MFGYINILKDDLKVRDYYIFRAYYCGLCKQIGKSCSHISRLGLSYDMTFLAVLLSSLSQECVQYKEGSCIAHPLNKRKHIINEPAIEYAAYASSLLFYLKIVDDWNDSKSIKSLLGMIIYRKAYKKSVKKYPQLSRSIKSHLNDLSNLEKENIKDIDRAADCFAKITQELFSPDFIGENKRAAAWLGYNIGRWIYVIDAYADLEKDIKHKNYNPFIQSDEISSLEDYKRNLAKNLDASLTFTLENAVSGFNLLKIYKNQDILENILFLSLKLKQDNILNYKYDKEV